MAWACIHVVSARASEDVCTYICTVSRHSGAETKKAYVTGGEESIEQQTRLQN